MGKILKEYTKSGYLQMDMEEKIKTEQSLSWILNEAPENISVVEM